MNADTLQLKATLVTFLSEGDEVAFFEWINKIQAVRKCQGIGDTIFIDVDNSSVDAHVVREFLALFFRYGIDMQQLRCFDTPEYAHWFRATEKYWHGRVFG